MSGMFGRNIEDFCRECYGVTGKKWPTVASKEDSAICTNCGLVVSEGNLVDDEWGVQKEDGPDMRRAEPLNGSSGWDMSTRIDGPDYNNLVKTQKYMSGNPHANRDKCLSDLVLGRLGLQQKVLDGAKDVWARVDRTHAKKGGRTDEGLALACVHLALKEQGMNASWHDLYDAAPICIESEGKAWLNFFQRFLSQDFLKSGEDAAVKSNTSSHGAEGAKNIVEGMIRSCGFEMGIKSDYGVRTACDIFRKASAGGLMSARNPATQAGAVGLAYRAMYLEDDYDLSEIAGDTAAAVMVERVTVLDCYEKLLRPRMKAILESLKLVGGGQDAGGGSGSAGVKQRAAPPPPGVQQRPAPGAGAAGSAAGGAGIQQQQLQAAMSAGQLQFAALQAPLRSAPLPVVGGAAAPSAMAAAFAAAALKAKAVMAAKAAAAVTGAAAGQKRKAPADEEPAVKREKH